MTKPTIVFLIICFLPLLPYFVTVIQFSQNHVGDYIQTGCCLSLFSTFIAIVCCFIKLNRNEFLPVAFAVFLSIPLIYLSTYVIANALRRAYLKRPVHKNFLTNGVFVELGGCRDGRHYMSPYLYQKGKKAEVGLLFSKEKEASQSCIFLPIVFFRIKKDSKIQCEDISFEFNKETATLTIHNIATFDCSTFNWPVLLERNKSLYRFAYPFLSVCLSKTYHFLMAANTEPKEKPKKKSWWYWIIVLVALGIFASFGILVWPKGETDDPAVIAVMSDLNFDLPNGVKLEMKKISAGTFMMGSPEDERGRFEEEVQHQVNLTNDFWLGQYEVMQAQYEAVMGTNPSKIKGNDLPVDGVSWDDAMAFCEKLNTLYADDSNLPAGYQFTLPTEAQWEYACRAGTTASLNNGKDISTKEGTCPDLDEVGWYQQNSDREPHSVGQKEPNAWGLYDMHGNVGEWCLDWYEDYPTDPVTDPKGPASASDRVMRGGSLMFHARYCRSACRGYDIPDCKTYVLGFRLALSNVQ